jgi:hypothetical protein
MRITSSRAPRGSPELCFYPHPTHSEWGSVDLRWVRRNAEAHGLPHSNPVLSQRALKMAENTKV